MRIGVGSQLLYITISGLFVSSDSFAPMHLSQLLRTDETGEYS